MRKLAPLAAAVAALILAAPAHAWAPTNGEATATVRQRIVNAGNPPSPFAWDLTSWRVGDHSRRVAGNFRAVYADSVRLCYVDARVEHSHVDQWYSPITCRRVWET